MSDAQPSYAVLSGGVGGAKLALGLQSCLSGRQLDVIVNTGDDFSHLGFTICPDLDTVLYTLAGLANPDTGWGVRDESSQCMAALEQLGGDTWFWLGDRDLATHIRRRQLLDNGLSLSEVTTTLAIAMQVATLVHPMSNDRVRTSVCTASEELDFQEYFVRRKAEPIATAIHYRGASTAHPSAGALNALKHERLAAIIISPSNPWLSIAPILAIAELQSVVARSKAPVIAVSPIVAGRAIKGPTAKLMGELGVTDGVVGIAEHYRDIIDALVIDTQDTAHKAAIEAMGIQVAVTDTIMTNQNDKQRLAQFVIEYANTVQKQRHG